MTIYANAPGTLSMLLLVPTIVLFLLLPIGRGTPNLTSLNPDSVFSIHNRALIQASMSPLPVLSILDRAHVMLMTVLSILAVDFQVFPRALAESETYGVSLVSPSLLAPFWARVCNRWRTFCLSLGGVSTAMSSAGCKITSNVDGHSSQYSTVRHLVPSEFWSRSR